MGTLPDIASATVRRHDLLQPGDIVLAMVSGGADSVALLHLLASGQLGVEVTLVAMHVNHMLRGADADADEQFVRDLCERLGVELEVVRFDVAEYARAKKLNLEEAGREVRYNSADSELNKLCRSAGLPIDRGRIAVGHSADDRVETFMMRLVAGAGAKGLTSLRHRRGRIVRPLADLSRSAIRNYLREQGEVWREDASNTDTTRLRARIREEILPALREINPRFDEATLRTIDILTTDDHVLSGVTMLSAHQLSTFEDEVLSFDTPGMASLSIPARRRVLRWALQDHFPESSRLEFAHLETLAHAFEQDAPKRFKHDLPGGLRARRRYGTISISHAERGGRALAPRLLSIPGTVELDGTGALHASVAALGDLSGNPYSIVIDGDLLGETLTVTGPVAGDRMRPLGMSGTKKVSDILIDAKVPAEKRPQVPVVRDGERIVWVAGVRMSDEYKVTAGTTRPVRLTWEQGRR